MSSLKCGEIGGTVDYSHALLDQHTDISPKYTYNIGLYQSTIHTHFFNNSQFLSFMCVLLTSCSGLDMYTHCKVYYGQNYKM